MKGQNVCLKNKYRVLAELTITPQAAGLSQRKAAKRKQRSGVAFCNFSWPVALEPGRQFVSLNSHSAYLSRGRDTHLLITHVSLSQRPSPGRHTDKASRPFAPAVKHSAEGKQRCSFSTLVVITSPYFYYGSLWSNTFLYLKLVFAAQQ